MGGHLRHGDPGVRLIEAGDASLAYFSQIPAPFAPQQGQWQVAPYYNLFGSDELSQRSGVIQQRMPQACAVVNQADAALLGVNAGALLDITCGGQTLRLPVRLSTELRQGQVGLPLGFPGIAPVLAGATVEMLREAAQ